MAQALKQLTAGFIYSVMTLSMILAPIPQTNLAWGEEAKDCYDGDGSNQAGRVYRKGCDFSKVVKKTDIQDTGSVHDSKFKQIFQQYVVGIFGMVLINSLDKKYTPRSIVDCPMNQVADTSLKLAQLSSLAFVLGDLISNMKFKEAAKNANDSYEFTAKTQTEEEAAKVEENTQIEAYNTLIKIYEKQLSGVKTKLSLSALAEAGFLATEYVELSGMAACKAKCAQTYGEAVGKVKSTGVALSTSIASLEAEMRTVKSAATVYVNSLCSNPATAAACAKGQQELQQFELMCLQTIPRFAKATPKTIGSILNKSKALAKKSGVLIKASVLKAAAWFGSFFSKISSFFKSPPNIPDTQVAENAAEQARGNASNAVQTQQQAVGKGLVQNLSAAVTQCESVPFVQTGMQFNSLKPSYKLLTRAAQQYVDQIQDQPTKATPVLCCGSDLIPEGGKSFKSKVEIDEVFTEESKKLIKSEGDSSKAKEIISLMKENYSKALKELATSDSSFLNHYPTIADATPFPSEYSGKRDIILKGLFDDIKLFKSKEDKKQSNEQSFFNATDYFEAITFNTMMKVAVAENPLTGNPSVDLAKQIEAVEAISKIMQAHRSYLAEHPEALRKLRRGLFASMEKGSPEEFVERVSTLFINDANAGMTGAVVGLGISQAPNLLGIDGKWAELFNLGGKLIMFQSVMKKFAREKALVSPIARSWTWAAMIAATGATLIFDAQAKGDIEKRLKVVKAEKKRYMESVAGSALINAEGSNNDGSGKLKLKEGASNDFGAIGQAGSPICAAPKAGGFAPASCEDNLTKSGFSLKKMDPRLKQNMDLSMLKGMNTISGMVGDVATGNIKKDGLSGAQLQKLDRVSNAFRNANENLRSRIDKAGSNGAGGKSSGTLQKMHSRMKALLGRPGGIAQHDLASVSPTSNGSVSEKESGEKPSSNMKSINVFEQGGGAQSSATVNQGDLDFGFGDGGGIETYEEKREVAVKPEENLEDFVIDHNDINERKDVSIFKILSNRYLLSYPKVLEEK